MDSHTMVMLDDVLRVISEYNRFDMMTITCYEKLVQRINELPKRERSVYTDFKPATDVNKCVMCGQVIPEGRMLCPLCEIKGPRWEEIDPFLLNNYILKLKGE